jgi:hypothetical protein
MKELWILKAQKEDQPRKLYQQRYKLVEERAIRAETKIGQLTRELDRLDKEQNFLCVKG